MSEIKCEMMCIFCAKKFTERKQLLKGKLPNLNQSQSNTFLICQKCGTNACHSCVSMIFDTIPQKDKSHDNWSKFVHNNITKMNFENVIIPVGHCCELKYPTDYDKTKTCKNKIMNMDTQTSYPKQIVCKVKKEITRKKGHKKQGKL